MGFPDYFPEGCPPQDAKFMQIDVYRYTKRNDVLHEEDFRSYHQMGKKFEDPEKHILSFGLSVLSDEAECKNGLLLPKTRKQYGGYARGRVADVGTAKATPSKRAPSHHTLWLFVDAKPLEHFVLCNVS